MSSVHILAIAGTFMGGVAALARELGHSVSGSDQAIYPPMSTQLEQLGITLDQGYRADSVPAGSGRLRWQHLADYRPSSLGGQLALLRSLVRALRERSAEVVFTAMPAAKSR